MAQSLRTYSTEDLLKWLEMLDIEGDDISRGSVDRIKMLMKREDELLFQLKGIRF